MPPKRKSKPNMAEAPTSPTTTAGNGNASKRGHSLQGVKSRLAPSIPFQMTTRRGAKTTSENMSPDGPSSASSGSRRSSLNAVQHYENASFDPEDERPAKRSRTSSDSGSPHLLDGSFDDNTPMNGTQTPELVKPEPDAPASAQKVAGKKRRASDDSTQSSSKTFGARPNGLLTRTQSDVSEPQPRRKKRKTTDSADAPDQPPELTDDSTAPNSPEPIPEVDGSQNLQNVLPTLGDAPAKTGRRLPGRRRQPHPDINIETDLRRQLNLKMSYRSLAKIQKTLLEELSQRTTDNLENDPKFHKEDPQYAALMTSLDQRRDSRLDQINALRTYRLEELERVRIAEEKIETEQYINRFEDLRDDFLLQCYFRMKQIEREMKLEADDATDDEDNVLPPTYTDEPELSVDDRISSKYASRSRAYVEADRELDGESMRKKFDLARLAFVTKDEEADDHIEIDEIARFTGPDREEAMAHYNMNNLVDAAGEVERTPSPEPKVESPRPLPQRSESEQASMLMLLADISAQVSSGTLDTRPQGQHVADSEMPDVQNTPEVAQEPSRQASPIQLAPILSTPSVHNTPKAPATAAPQPILEAPFSQPNGVSTTNEVAPSKNVTPARVSTHRIMDMLNNDDDLPAPRLRDPRPTLPSFRDTPSNQSTVLKDPRPAVAAAEVQEQPPVDQLLMDALGEKPQTVHKAPSTPPVHYRPWLGPSLGPSSAQSSENEDALRRRDPLRRLLGRAREESREPSEPSQSESWKRAESTAYPEHRPEPRAEGSVYDPTKPSSTPYYLSGRRGSTDQGGSQWDRERHASTSQAHQPPSASPYQGAAQPAISREPNRAPFSHQSPYAPASSNFLSKSSGPSSSTPINFRFAHYDPAPPRPPTYPPTSPNFAAASHAPPGPPGPSGPPPPPQPPYNTGYAALPSYQSGYQPAPPTGPFGAPLPPPPSTLPGYPPLKIHQYGGQPILPANMAPPPPSGPPHMTFLGQPAGPPPPGAYSPPQGQPPVPHYEPQPPQSVPPPPPPREPPQERPEPQTRPRRQYRSWHAPGTQFRTYQGPSEKKKDKERASAASTAPTSGTSAPATPATAPTTNAAPGTSSTSTGAGSTAAPPPPPPPPSQP